MIFKNSITQDQIKEINRINVLSLIREHSPITKQAIAKALSLSIPTVTTNINELEHEGLVKQGDMAESSGGRRPVTIELIESARYSIGVCVGIHSLRLAIMNLGGDVLFQEEHDISDQDTFDELTQQIKRYILAMIDVQTIHKGNILGVGIALPGMVDDEHNILINAPNLNVTNYDFNPLANVLDLPVFIENEANIAAFAEHAIGFSKNINNFVYISITDGVGCGIIISDRIYKGSSNRAGEFGHIRISDKPIQCNCGRYGCWELFSSNQALIHNYNPSSSGHSLSEVFDAYAENNVQAKSAIENYCKYLVRGIENILLALNPDCIVVGGEIAKYADAMHNFIKDADNIPVYFSPLANDASLLGAAMIPMQSLLSFSNITL